LCISSCICADEEYIDLRRFVHFEYLLSECISDFLSSLPNSIDRRLWESISRRLISHIPYAVEFPLQEAELLDGIISYLTRKHAGNAHDKGIATITSRSIYDDHFMRVVRNVAGLTYGSYFDSNDEPGR
jgi:hypothetical protein